MELRDWNKPATIAVTLYDEGAHELAVIYRSRTTTVEEALKAADRIIAERNVGTLDIPNAYDPAAVMTEVRVDFADSPYDLIALADDGADNGTMRWRFIELPIALDASSTTHIPEDAETFLTIEAMCDTYAIIAAVVAWRDVSSSIPLGKSFNGPTSIECEDPDELSRQIRETPDNLDAIDEFDFVTAVITALAVIAEDLELDPNPFIEE